MKNKTKKMIVLLLLLAAIAMPIASWAAEEADKATGGVDLSVLSAYIWRGQELTRHSVVVQPSATIGYKGFTFNAWGNLDTKPYSSTDASYSSNYTETDITLSYAKKLGIVQVGGGYIYYALAAPYSGAPDPLDSPGSFSDCWPGYAFISDTDRL
jgi:hypothetical protein